MADSQEKTEIVLECMQKKAKLANIIETFEDSGFQRTRNVNTTQIRLLITIYGKQSRFGQLVKKHLKKDFHTHHRPRQCFHRGKQMTGYPMMH